MKFSIKSIDILIENLCFTDYVIVTEEISNLELEIERLNNENEQLRTVLNSKESIIKEVRDYIELVETLATVDKVNIMSMSSLKSILDKE